MAQEVAIDPVIIIEMNGWRVRSEVEWPKGRQELVVVSRLVDQNGEPIPQAEDEGAPPAENRHLVVITKNPDYTDRQLLYDVEVIRFQKARDLAGHPHIMALREKVGPHRKAVQLPPVVTAPRHDRPEKPTK